MGLTYKIDVEAGVILTFGEGEINAADIREVRARYSADPLYNPKFHSLFDGRSAKISYGGEEARNMALWAKRNRPAAKMAFVIGPQSQGFLRMYTAWGGENQQLFHDMAVAREWLGLPSEDNS